MATLVIPTNTLAVPGPLQGQWTYADWKTLLEDGCRYEVIHGVLYMTPAPSFFHQWIVRRLDRFIGSQVEEWGLGVAVVGPVRVLMPHCDPVLPDFVVVLSDKFEMIHDGCIVGVPDLIVEVLSPGRTVYDTDVKLKAYAKAQLPEYAVIDPDERIVTLYRLEQPDLYTNCGVLTEGDKLTFQCLPDLITTPVWQLFAGSPDLTL